jgi:chaperone required for assembly of F1-ATPase
MERATYTTKSFIIALALVKRHLTSEQAAEAAQAEVNSQIERWGEVEDCEFSPLRINALFRLWEVLLTHDEFNSS